MPFTELGLSPSLCKSLKQHKFKKPFPIQKQVIPPLLSGKDVLGIAQTGSGKTASFVLPILMNLQKRTETKNRHINVLVLVPTRELADQVRAVFSLFSRDLPVRVKSLAVYGGVSINTQMQDLQHVNVLVATPGRLLDLVDSNAVHLSSVETLVLDESDKMLNLGFKEEMDRIFALLPQQRQNALFSATLSEDLESIKAVLLQDPVVITIKSEEIDLNLINQAAYFVPSENKGPLLRYLIKHNDLQQVLVFVSSSLSADKVAEKLRKNNIEAIATHGKKSQSKRQEALLKFKEGRIRVLVTTDLLSRGIDIVFLPVVINYELPRSPKDYIHRIGRTGRAEAPGEAITLVVPDDEHHFKVIQKKMGRWVTRVSLDNINLHGY